MAKIIIKGNYDLFRPTSPFFVAVTEAVNRGVPIQKVGEQGVLEVSEAQLIPLSVVQSWHDAGGSIEGYPVAIKMSVEDYAQTVPSYVPNNAFFDEEGNETPKLWSDWKDENHFHIKNTVDTSVIVLGNSFGVELASDVIVQLVTNGYNVIQTHLIKDHLNIEEGEF